MAKVPAVHREARFSGIRVAVSIEKSVLPDTHTCLGAKCERLHLLKSATSKLQLPMLLPHLKLTKSLALNCLIPYE